MVGAPGRRQDRVHRLDRGRASTSCEAAAEHRQARHAGAGRQVAQHRLRRRRSRRRRRRAPTSASSTARASLLPPARGCSSRSRSTTSSSRSWSSARRSMVAGDPLDPRDAARRRWSRRSSATACSATSRRARRRARELRRAAAGRRDRRQGLLHRADGLRRRRATTMKIAREEIFGPVLAVIPFKDVDEAVALAQRHDLRPRRRRLDARHRQGPPAWRDGCRPARCGSTATTVFDAAAPFGGYKHERLRPRARQVRDRVYTEVKTVYVGR